METIIKYLEEPYEVIDRPLQWQLDGRMQTATGYGSKLTSSRCVKLPDGRIRRIYVTCCSNAGSSWITLDKEMLHLRD